MLYELFKQKTGNKYLEFIDAECSTNKWQEDLLVTSLSCYYKTIEGEHISFHFTTTNYYEIEIRPVFSTINEKTRIESSKVVQQIILLIKEKPSIFDQSDCKNFRFIYSDLLIDNFHAYEKRASLSFLFENKMKLLTAYSALKDANFDTEEDSERFLCLVGKDGLALSNFLKEAGIAEIVYHQDDLLSVLKFDAIVCTHICNRYLKQLFVDMGYICYFTDSCFIQNLLHRTSFLFEGGKYDLSSYFSF